MCLIEKAPLRTLDRHSDQDLEASNQRHTMGFLTRALETVLIYPVVLAGVGYGSFVIYTRNSRFDPSFGPSKSDSVFSLPSYARQNPSDNTTFHDYCVQKVPLSKIRPGLLADEGKLVETFCQGVWSGLGMSMLLEIPGTIE